MSPAAILAMVAGLLLLDRLQRPRMEGVAVILRLGPLKTVIAVALCSNAHSQESVDSPPDWSEFRGPGRSGVAAVGSPPTHWSGIENVRWKVPLPGPGASSPITFGNHVYVTCYSGYGVNADAPGQVADLTFHLVCVDRDSGSILWSAAVPASGLNHGYSGYLTLHGYATSTPAADNSGVYVFFGSSGVFGYSHAGELLWDTPLGNGTHAWGSASSPVLFEDRVIVHADIECGALVALNKGTGREAWRVPTGSGDSWSTPLLLSSGGDFELVYHHEQGEPAARMAAVNPRDGTPLWQCRVLRNYLCPSPIAHDGLVYAIAYQRAAAIRAGGRGDVTASHVAWDNRQGLEVGTPLYHDGRLYYAHQESGIAYCIDAGTGGTVYAERLEPPPGRIYASGVLADGRIYYVSRQNGTYVVAADPEFRQLAHNRIESDSSVFNGTPAISGDRLLLRSDRCLYCIGE